MQGSLLKVKKGKYFRSNHEVNRKYEDASRFNLIKFVPGIRDYNHVDTMENPG